ncbi:5'-methylthioadenosine/S-adenosylhomocysteine nucleosidase [Schinkia azotoformans MEV2011]|uniref:5'-methylthioadenosine/S-adenosylhomocysteine nucleosidase n=1 Tax=Schinkia azotoformans MEV2011 TaxID=1348973 RepID=A0A072NPF8_SCHAZ|nr:5'-methylthioadenosine/S-adenosylhomocysteine nucleosidase [Schinkia azotoformans]KEF39371.1 5'-methylthioadenosine/S-adenosylhomocysteine nucleosidase [Schinkia azotoformans MEV2011]MEC1694877.1 5'-methylthioadenosine/S-adenosylhomocysteine nucleosidase [Schinkia azotoformans]MEC1726711.1 5'-methylthioadenosine/S-adenosylhomocysteine nucleosidase [Schinkia azotoformans]MEC1779750.1 5'-methylthioadenosine/S-adenosylhomocysteine nucleosidase [Schinkia azotoformans]MED4327569.1 5'-methylthioa
MKIGIIGAMDEEVAILKEKIQNREDLTIGKSEFSIGKINNIDVVLLKSGIGKVNAAVGTTLLLDHFKPDYVLNTGSAGGYHTELHVGDIVISTDVRHHDVDVTVFGYEYGQVPQMPPGFTPDVRLIEKAEKAAAGITDIKVAKGLIVTGDSFMDDPVRVDFVRGKFTDVYAVEMEAAAIAQVCHLFNVPFVIIRALSDIAGKDSDVSFDKFLEKAALHSATLILNIVSEFEQER